MAAPKSLSPGQRRERARIAGLRSQSAEVLAAKIARDWPALTPSQKSLIRTVLTPVLRTRGPYVKKAS